MHFKYLTSNWFALIYDWSIKERNMIQHPNYDSRVLTPLFAVINCKTSWIKSCLVIFPYIKY